MAQQQQAITTATIAADDGGFINPLAKEMVTIKSNTENNATATTSAAANENGDGAHAKPKMQAFSIEDEIEAGENFTHFQVGDYRFDRRGANVRGSAVTTNASGLVERFNKVKFLRCVMYTFLAFYMLFAVLLFTGNDIQHTHKEVVLSKIAELSVSEPSVRRFFSATAFFVALTSLVGYFSLNRQSSRLFLIFALLLLFTVFFTIFNISISISAYNQMKKVAKDNVYFKESFKVHLSRYNWTSLEDPDSVFINRFQLEFQCCGGMKGYHDWEGHPNRPQGRENGVFPFSCCRIHFTDLIVPTWCGYQQVESMRSCPAAFNNYLGTVLSTYKAMNAFVLEALFLQLIAIGVFFSMILRFDRAINVAH